jgi:hypothetical protein
MIRGQEVIAGDRREVIALSAERKSVPQPLRLPLG